MPDETDFGWPYPLVRGHAEDPARGACAMAALSWIEDGTHSDCPPCASPVVGAYVRAANDMMDDASRQFLLPYLPRIAGSAVRGAEGRRVRALNLYLTLQVATASAEAGGAPRAAAILRAAPAGAARVEFSAVSLMAAGACLLARKPTLAAMCAGLALRWILGNPERVLSSPTGRYASAAALVAVVGAASFLLFPADADAGALARYGFPLISGLLGGATALLAFAASVIDVPLSMLSRSASGDVLREMILEGLDVMLEAGPQGGPWAAGDAAMAAEAFGNRSVPLSPAEG